MSRVNLFTLSALLLACHFSSTNREDAGAPLVDSARAVIVERIRE